MPGVCDLKRILRLPHTCFVWVYPSLPDQSCPPLPQLEEHAAKAHDVLALRCRGNSTVLNYEGNIYEPLRDIIPQISRVGRDPRVSSRILISSQFLPVVFPSVMREQPSPLPIRTPLLTSCGYTAGRCPRPRWIRGRPWSWRR